VSSGNDTSSVNGIAFAVNFLWVAFLVGLISFVSTTGSSLELRFIWLGGAAIAGGAFIYMMIQFSYGNREAALGVLAGLVVGGIALYLSCLSIYDKLDCELLDQCY